ncbi:hypothetical protein A9Q84_13950 [Halobacteriovorax marinus]|uniref:Solute-binding protein family 3/N-terminal domain-containing protein n=1 Tax=Halobacteriovorax marinus TaxID=97084 RepID=A0A1Y5F9E8_9BACT|nr:hypothetical protein A9Q84_13950 [Halobacteriovorax marinus]
MEKNNIGMTIDFLPWKRAIKSVQTGENDALLTVVLEEAPSLSFTTVPTMSYRVCLFSGNSKIEEIKNITQLSKKRIGIASQYGYGAPFDKYILENKNNKDRILTLFGGNLVSRFILLTQKKRISYFLEDENVVNFYRKKIKSTFCTKKNPFFIGFSPLYINKEKLIKILDDEALREDFSRN